ncbi:hemin ABC transporter ATP binding protein [Imhoffiella purpurea]|uniref:Hemin ABC transporter ATP binding protein n=1 Tax=Imhoffiella purpurea TaxID=1249627 RepID=W9VK39_9GAMM|nr:hemin ABC transporter ATP binding protein [Imhoffiella purpurea]
MIRDGRALIDGVSLTLNPGEVLVILGANGAGKSTLLRCLSGELRPDAGEIRLNGVPLAAWSSGDCARRRAILPQQSPLNFPFTALEVAAMGRIPHGGPGPGDTRIAAAALAAAEAEHLAERRYTTLSGGERQRVHLARILAQLWSPLPNDEPRYLLLDEPTASLDLAHQHATLALARRWTDRNIGVLVVLHDLNLAAQYGDRIALMKQGRLLALDRPRAVLEPPLIEQAFGLPVSVIPHPEMGCPLVIPRQIAA